MHDLVLGLEVVLPDGLIWYGLRSVQKDNAGYQLRKLFCGAEGTLGVVTRASLRLFPKPISRATALLVVQDMEALVCLGQSLRGDLGEFISALEFFSDAGLGLALRHLPGLKYPLEGRGAAYALIEVETTSGQVDLSELLESVLAQAFEADMVIDGGNCCQRHTARRLLAPARGNAGRAAFGRRANQA